MAEKQVDLTDAALGAVGDAAAAVAGPAGGMIRLLFGRSKKMTPEDVHAQGGVIMTGEGSNTPPSAVLPDGTRLFAVDTETEDAAGITPKDEIEAYAAKLAQTDLPAEDDPEAERFGPDTQSGGVPVDEDRAAASLRSSSAAAPAPDGTSSTPEDAEGATFGAQGEPNEQDQQIEVERNTQLESLINLLKEEILKPLPGFQGPRPLTTGEHIALGIIGALDADAFAKQIMPMLQQERALPLAQAEWEKDNHNRAVQALQGLTQIMALQESRDSQAAARTEQGRHNRELEKGAKGQRTLQAMQEGRLNSAATEAARHAKEMERIAAERNRIMADKGQKPKPLSSSERLELASLAVIKKQAKRVIAFMAAHPNVKYPLTKPLVIGSKEFSDFSAMLGDLTSAFAVTRGGRNLTKVELRIMGGTVPSMNATGNMKQSALEEILQWASDKEEAIRDQYDMEGLPGDEVEGIVAPDAPPPGTPPGLTPMGMQVDDDLLEGAN